MTVFDRVPLPDWPRGGLSLPELEAAVGSWVSSPAIRNLAEASGWAWPQASAARDLIGQLVVRSADWDFRGQRERNFIPGTPAEVSGRIVPDGLVRDAAEALGLVHADPLPDRQFTHLTVLSGLVGACVNRTHRAADLTRAGAGGQVAVLGARRPLGGNEPERARDLGFGDLTDEAEAILAATRQSFGLAAPPISDVPPVPPEGPNAARARYRWPEERIDVVIVPSSDPPARRANTADQLRYWADLAGIGSGHDVLLVTTQIYVPFQHLDAVRVLGLERGCGVYSCGVDAKSSLLPAKEFGGRDYLQEVRSAIRAAAALLAAAERGPGGG